MCFNIQARMSFCSWVIGQTDGLTDRQTDVTILWMYLSERFTLYIIMQSVLAGKHGWIRGGDDFINLLVEKGIRTTFHFWVEHTITLRISGETSIFRKCDTPAMKFYRNGCWGRIYLLPSGNQWLDGMDITVISVTIRLQIIIVICLLDKKFHTNYPYCNRWLLLDFATEW